jgi:hypothetical protein
MPATGRLALSTSKGVIDRVHRHASNGGALVLPPSSAGLAESDQLGLRITNFPYGRTAVEEHHPHLTRREPHLGVLPLLGYELDGRARRPGHLPAGARLELDVVNHRAHRDVP